MDAASYTTEWPAPGDDLGISTPRIHTRGEQVRDLAAHRRDGPAPTYTDMAIAIGGGAVVIAVVFALSVHTMRRLTPEGAHYSPIAYLLEMVTTLACAIAIPRTIVPVPFLDARADDGSYDAGIRLPRGTWLTIAAIAIVVHAFAIAFFRPS